MSYIGGYGSRMYERLEDLSEHADWIGRSSSGYDDAIKQYVEALHTAAKIRAAEHPTVTKPAEDQARGRRVVPMQRGIGRRSAGRPRRGARAA
ncbi:hypothetical protein [Nocardia xishanensis]|uniref:hypothetical protein n=1 Tax=Nocardia xishanensis TaxID=238964 RepID=UPI0008346FF9|nr:hypothetical protein [Nocardia xishanensis]